MGRIVQVSLDGLNPHGIGITLYKLGHVHLEDTCSYDN